MVIVLSTVVLGSAGGSVPFNFPPARALLGDTGSMTFGFWWLQWPLLLGENCDYCFSA